MFDTLILHGTVIDGSGSSSYQADVGISKGKIAEIGNLSGSDAAVTISADGLCITPGFIDIHRHADAAVFRSGFGEAELRQGLTTIINGNCGVSVAPFGSTHRTEICRYLEPITGAIPADLPSEFMEEYLNAVPITPIHTGMLAGAGVLRADAAGYQVLHPDDTQFDVIHRNMEKALADGAFGISLGLGYAPECFYTTEELIRALLPLKDGNIPITVHMRQEGSGVVNSVEEMMQVAAALRCPVHISHLKAMGKQNWNSKVPQALRLMERARGDGLCVDCDVYPYTAGSTQLLHILPPEFLTGGMEAVTKRLADPEARKLLADRIRDGSGFDNIAALAGWDGILLTSLHRDENLSYLGKSLAEIGELRGQSPLDACCDLLVSEQCMITMIDFMASEDDIITILRNPLSNVISDSTYPTEGNPHPRVYGTFTRAIEHFVLEKKALTLEEMICKMTGKPASVLSISGKGLVKPGMDADLCIFDPAKLHENATYTDPRACSTGMDYVLVGGRIVLEKDRLTGISNGHVLRRSV